VIVRRETKQRETSKMNHFRFFLNKNNKYANQIYLIVNGFEF
jgi:hypothetical protein